MPEASGGRRERLRGDPRGGAPGSPAVRQTTRMGTVSALLRATHLAPSLLVTAMAAVLAASSGRTAAGTMAVATAVVAGQFSVGWGNDWVDRGRDTLNARAEKPIVAGRVPADLVRACALGALGVCAALSLLSGPRAAAVHLLAVGLGWAYDLRLKSTVWSAACYAGAFALLPVFVTTGLPGAPVASWWAVAGAGLLGAGAHFTNALPDLDADADAGVRGLPQRVGPGWSMTLAALLLAGGAVLVLGGAGLTVATGLGIAVVAVLTVAVLVAGRTGRQRLAWSLTLGVAGIAVVAFAASGGALV